MIVKNRSIFISLLLQNIFLITIIVIILSFTAYQIIKSNYIKSLTEELKNESLIIKNLTFNDYINKNFDIINDKVYSISNNINKRITIIQIDGIVIADSDKNYLDMENHIDRPEIIQAINEKVGSSIRYSNTLKLNMLYVAVPIKNNEKVIGVYRISVRLSEINEVIKGFKMKIFIMSLILFLITFFLAYIISLKITQPIRMLTDASEKVSKGNFDISLFYKKGAVELLKLVDNFNTMTFKLKSYFNELNYEKEELASIFSSTKDGIIVVDNSGKIVRYNNSFSNIVNRNNIINKYYWEVIRDTEIADFIKKGSSIKSAVKEIILNNKTLLCSMNYLLSNKGFVFIFYDITNLKNLEKIKKDFVSNVSHELRTPLTAIKGFTETLLEEEKNKNKLNYLKIINSHTERLSNIVEDLLTLSKIEEEKISIVNLEKINLIHLINSILSIFEQRKKVKDLKVVLKKGKNIKEINSDPFKLEQILLNLIDNAIKYTDKGKIEIKLFENQDKIKIDIIDSGIGIPEKDLARIFERFYVVDKSRSKKNGGTGLGLSIVKHNILLLNGEINVTSILGQGTTFTVNIPKNIIS